MDLIDMKMVGRYNLSLENIEYRAEGNVGLVIYLKKEGLILRLIKKSCFSDKPIDKEMQLQNFQSHIQSIRKLFTQLLGKSVVYCPGVAFVKKEEIIAIKRSFDCLRPEFRMHKTLHEEDSYALVLPDFSLLPPHIQDLPTTGPTISIEIKVKQGFLSEEAIQPPTPTDQPILLCRHCMMQNLKIKKGITSIKSPYCPTDLFSGCPVRMKHALKCLFRTPQNNLRIFKNQKLVFCEENKSDLVENLTDFSSGSSASKVNLFSDLVIRILLNPISDKVYPLRSGNSRLACRNAHLGCCETGECHKLPAGCILHKILDLQRLHTLHIRDLHPLYMSIKDYKNIINLNELPPHIGEKNMVENETYQQYASRKVLEFLLSLTAKDCSVMLVLKQYTGIFNPTLEEYLILGGNDRLYVFSIAMADLDLKHPQKVEEHFHQTSALLQSCLSQI